MTTLKMVAAVMITATAALTLTRNPTNLIIVDAFRSTPPLNSVFDRRIRHHPRSILLGKADSTTESDGKIDDEDHNKGRDSSMPSSSLSPASNMNDYVTRFLDKNSPPPPTVDDIPMDEVRLEDAKLADIADATHLIAIPMEQSHELMLELESVQRAILYHCPILLDACISAASTRLPLLYVQADSAEQSIGRVTTALGQLVDRLVKKHIFRAEADPDDKELNAEGFRPVTMTFQSLEIEGDNNSILSTVGFLENNAKDDEMVPQSTTSLTRFSNFMRDLQYAVAAQGWKMTCPPDPNNKKTNGDFRPRISFMELPTSFDENISRYKSPDEKLRDEEMEFLTSAQGGNGISPIFWCQWWDDVFGRNVRMREIGIYPRSPADGAMARNSRFFVPYERIPLPDGSPSMLQSERKFQEYQEQRLEDEQDLVYRANQNNDSDGFVPPKTKFAKTNTATSSNAKATESDLMMTKTRERLERIFLESGGENDVELQEGIIDDKSSAGESIDEKVDLKAPNHLIQSKDDDFMEDWMKERIKKAVNSLESVKVQNPVKKEMPPIKDNPVFKAYMDGTLIPKEERIKKKTRDLGPYPGNSHFVGIWKMVSSPTGFDIDDSDENASENLILRVDGTTAGGPTLNLQTRQKAAGGTWKMIPQEKGDVLLRIRLVIPPEKNRILVMEGLVQRMGSQAGIPTAPRTFGIPEVEDRLKSVSGEQLQLMTCSGKVHVEDAVTKKNRELIGEFSLMKLQGPKDKNEYMITIPKPVRNLN